jgi:inhibitor of cysteine peptidase
VAPKTEERNRESPAGRDAIGRTSTTERNTGGASATNRRSAVAPLVAGWWVPLVCACTIACTPAANTESSERKTSAMASAQTCIDESGGGQERAVAVGRTFEICLRENPTTGYRWRRDAEGAPVAALIGDGFEADDGPPGAGGVHRWLFRAEQPGAVTLAFSYRRPWEKDEAPARTFTVVVRVEA